MCLLLIRLPLRHQTQVKLIVVGEAIAVNDASVAVIGIAVVVVGADVVVVGSAVVVVSVKPELASLNCPSPPPEVFHLISCLLSH